MSIPRRRLPDMDRLLSFETAARLGSFTAAAQELALTQSAISRHIRELEEQLGVALFERFKQRIILSNQGAVFLLEIRKILDQTERAMNLLSDSRSGVSLNIGAISAFANLWLIPNLSAFMAANPSISIGIFTYSNDQEPDRGMDGYIRYGVARDWHAACRPLRRERLVPVSSARLVAQHGSIEAALRLGPRIHHVGYPGAWERYFGSSDRGGAGPPQSHRFDTFSLVVQAVDHGLGSALIPDHYIAKSAGSTDRVELHSESVEIDRYYYFERSPSSLYPQEVELFHRWLADLSCS
jgi:LysR family glycine cleavage system transcriptional activator